MQDYDEYRDDGDDDSSEFVHWLRASIGRKAYRAMRRKFEGRDTHRPTPSQDAWWLLYSHLKWLRSMYTIQMQLTPDPGNPYRVRLRSDIANTLRDMRALPKRKLP